MCGSLGARTKPNLSLSHQTWTLSARAVGLDVSEGRYKSPAYLDTAKLRLTTLYLEATKLIAPETDHSDLAPLRPKAFNDAALPAKAISRLRSFRCPRMAPGMVRS